MDVRTEDLLALYGVIAIEDDNDQASGKKIMTAPPHPIALPIQSYEHRSQEALLNE